jgi:SsrA-binding protein
VKSIKTQSVNITQASASIVNGTLWLYGMDVQLYKKTSPIIAVDYDPKRKRRLLVNQKELAKIAAATDKKGMVLVPLEVFLTLK